MRQRNLQCFSHQMIDLGIDRQDPGGLPRLDPSFVSGTMNNVSHNIPPMLSGSSGNPPNAHHHSQEHYDNFMFCETMQYNNCLLRHLPSANMHMGVPAASNFHNPYMNPSSRVVPFPLNHGSSVDQFPASSDEGVIGVRTDEYGRNISFVDGARGLCKRKNAEGIPTNPRCFDASASSSSSAVPFGGRQFDSGVLVLDAAPFSLPEFSGFGNLTMMEIESQRSMRNRSSAVGLDTGLAHNHHRHLAQGSYRSQPFHPVGPPWFDQQPSTIGDASISTWNRAPVLPYIHGNTVNGGSLESGNLHIQGYIGRSSIRSSLSSAQPPLIHQQYDNIHHPVVPIQGVRNDNVSFYPSYGNAANNASCGAVNPSPDSADVGSRYPGPIPRRGIRMYRSSRRGVVPAATSRNHISPHLRYSQDDATAILELPGFYEVGDLTDHHRDMRLDIDDMSYEELLALGERIGNVATGLSQEDIINHMRTKTFASVTSCLNSDKPGRGDGKTDFCVICQGDYQNQEKIGILYCGHEYHTSCVTKWLLMKNACPICKAPAANARQKDT